MIRRPLIIIGVFVSCLVVTFIAMGLVSAIALRLERSRAQSAQEAALEENVRLALWRMDSALSTFIAAESARPYYVYNSSYTLAEASFPEAVYSVADSDKRFPSPLLRQNSPHIRLHFQFDPFGKLTSPQVMAEGEDIALANTAARDQNRAASMLLEKVAGILNRESVLLALGKESQELQVSRAPLLAARDTRNRSRASQSARSEIEWYNRAVQNIDINTQMITINNDVAIIPARDPKANMMKPDWINEELFLARVIDPGEGALIQGCWLDWPEIKRWMLGEIEDLLPEADILPATKDSGNGPGRMLAALPVKLEPGPLPTGIEQTSSPVRLTLIFAWISTIIAAVAVAVLLIGAVTLSERRGAFVSAVTHELRTPLTTFRMYTEMLAEDMVKEEKRKAYLETLRGQAERLGHLVENVLSYSRLEKGDARECIESISLEELLDRVLDQLCKLSNQAGMSLEADASQDLLSMSVRADPSAVERILFNLVDNACKYASQGSDKTIHLEIASETKFVLIRIRDHGPGIAKKDLRRLFKPFSKSAQAAANSAPGVGLGLVLSRGLARNMGGDLYLEINTTQGACFTMALLLT